MANVIIGIDERKSSRLKGDKYPIILTVHNNYKTIRIRLKISTAKSNWDARGMKLKRGEECKQVNARIQSYYRRAKQFLTSNVYEIQSMSFEEFKERLQIEIFTSSDTTEFKKATHVAKKLNGASLTDFAIKKIDRLRLSHKHGNAEVIEQSMKRMYAFCNRDNLNFAEIDITFLKDFTAYCLSRNNKPNTISIYLRPIKTLFFDAIGEGLIPAMLNPFAGKAFKIPRSSTKNRALTKKDIEAIRNVDLVIGSADWKARAYFLFMFNSRGMNFIDLAKMKVQQLNELEYNVAGEIVGGRFQYDRTKLGGKKELSVRLTKEACEIINYFMSKRSADSDFIFPMGYVESETGRKTYKQQRKRVNRRLKDIAKEAKISDEMITTYYARHSWATIADRHNLSINLIKDALGNSSINTTQTYIDSFNNSDIDDANDQIVA